MAGVQCMDCWHPMERGINKGHCELNTVPVAEYIYFRLSLVIIITLITEWPQEATFSF